MMAGTTSALRVDSPPVEVKRVRSSSRKRMPGALLALAFCAFLSACSPRTEAAPGDLVHRILPLESDLGEDWKFQNEDSFDDELARMMADTRACRALNDAYWEDANLDRVRAAREFSSRQTRGLRFRSHAEEAPDADRLIGYPEYLQEFYRNANFGRCYADWFEDESGNTVTPRLQEPAPPVGGTASVAWTFEMEREQLILRYEVYFWTEERLALLAEFVGPEGEVQPETGTVLDAFRRKVKSVLDEEP